MVLKYSPKALRACTTRNGNMKKAALLFFVISATTANACGVEADYVKNLIAQTDANKDGKITFNEFQVIHSHKPDYIVDRTWLEQGGSKGYLTPDEFVGDTVQSIEEDCRRSEADAD